MKCEKKFPYTWNTYFLLLCNKFLVRCAVVFPVQCFYIKVYLTKKLTKNFENIWIFGIKSDIQSDIWPKIRFPAGYQIQHPDLPVAYIRRKIICTKITHLRHAFASMNMEMRNCTGKWQVILYCCTCTLGIYRVISRKIYCMSRK